MSWTDEILAKQRVCFLFDCAKRDFEGNTMSHFPVRFAARISVGKAAKLLGVHRNTLVRSWFKEKGLIKLKMSPTGRWFVETRELERVLKARTLAGPSGQFVQTFDGDF